MQLSSVSTCGLALFWAITACPQVLAAGRSLQQAPNAAAAAQQAAINRNYTTFVRGTPGTFSYRLYLKQDGRTISWWHDIPLALGNGLYNYVCEIPAGTSPKIETTTDKEVHNPLFQDVLDGKLRFYPNGTRLAALNLTAPDWNYGGFPQTWEDPSYSDPAVNRTAKGDGDPLDVVSIDSHPCKSGGIYVVKILGAFPLIDAGELDWKTVVISATDPLAPRLNDITDVDRVKPGQLDRICRWFINYKRPKSVGLIANNGQPYNRQRALAVLNETRELWRQLMLRYTPNTDNKTLS